MKAIVSFYLLTMSILLNAQELKRITKSNMHFGEVYHVLKSDKNIKQGQYLKYFESMNRFDKAIESFGIYDNNKKSGTWIFCDAESLTNPLISFGEYNADKKNNSWVFFYIPESDNSNYGNLLGAHKHTKVILPTKRNEQINITIDTIGLRTAATGNYVDDQKSGIWSYYYKNGLLACKYDFSTNTMTLNNGLENYDQLGGIERFKILFHKSAFEMKINDQPFFFENSNAVFELTTNHESLKIKLINSTGIESFAKTMENIIANMPLDWINYDPRLEDNKIKIVLNYIVQDDIGNLKLESIEPLKK